MPLSQSLNGSGGPLALDRPGWTLRAPGVVGGLELTRPVERSPGTRSPERSTPDLDAALARAALTELASLEVRTDRMERVPAGVGLRAPSTGGDALELEVPALADHAQVVLLTDESGALSWHFATDAEAWPQEVRSPSRGGPQATLTFRIPNEVVPPAPGAEPTHRGLVQILGKKVLKVLVYPLTDPILQVALPLLAGAWEGRHRPYRVRRVELHNYGVREAPEVAREDWARNGGRALLFVHGTFSSIHGSFHHFSRATMQALHAHYQGRVFGFDHPTLSESPEDNVRRFLERVPPGLDLDIVCHSRGGLVARTLQQAPSPFGLDTGRIRVRRTVLVAVPNDGTILTDAGHMVHMLDRFTNALNLFPTGTVGDVLDAVLMVVKVVGKGALDSLPGLLAMRPDGEFLTKLNQPGQTGEYFAVAADYEPTESGLRHLVKATADAALDRVFKNEPNDLVVPEPGVYGANGGAGFPVPDDRVLRLGRNRGLIHTNVFSAPDVQAAIVGWLTA